MLPDPENYISLFTLLIPTKNRRHDLEITLNSLKDSDLYHLKCVICVDGSTDDTVKFLKENHPNIKLLINQKSLGIHATRNRLFNSLETPFAICLDDDANFITTNFLQELLQYFHDNESVGLVSFCNFWGKEFKIKNRLVNETERVRSFAALAFAIRTKAWHSIPNLPEWFIFYGEEDFISINLLLKNWQVHYYSKILVHHRVNLKIRRKQSDHLIRTRLALRSGWFLYFMYYPIIEAFIHIAYSVYSHLKRRLRSKDYIAILAIFQSSFDFIIKLPKLLHSRNPLRMDQYKFYKELNEPRIF